MQYDPIKFSLGKVFNKKPFLRIIFYKLLDILLLRTWHIKKAIKKWAKNQNQNIEILDAGSGFGQYTYYLSSLNKKWNITGVDVKEEQIEDCNDFFKKINRKNTHFEIADLTKYKKPESFDMILSVDVMEHILEDVEVFKNFYASLKKDGVLFISTPSDQGGSDAHDHHEGSFIDEHVRNGYSIIDIEEKLKKAGFKNIQSKYSYGKPGNISWILSMKYPIEMLNISKLFFLILPVYYIILFPFCLILNSIDVNKKHNSGTGLIIKAKK
ncbi:MAG: class I SAM-dependent methyltransferase [Bacteroidales bacterium]|nr:class I SAM-dependent methyltransferase [Bacteroidales bacterium]